MQKGWRTKHLEAMITGLEELKEEFGVAITADLGKKREANLFEICIVLASIKHDLKHIDSYTKT